jgi:integrase
VAINDSHRLEKSTRASYRSAYRFWDSRIGSVALHKLTLTELKEALYLIDECDESDKLPSEKTLNNYRSALSVCLNSAVEDGLIAQNLVEKLPKLKAQKPLPDPFNPEERDRIIDYFDSNHGASISNYVRFWFWSGLRTGELLGLRWRDIDFEKQRFDVVETVVRGERKASTKTKRARTVPLHPLALAALRSQFLITGQTSETVFFDATRKLGWFNASVFAEKYWHPALAESGIRKRRPYCIRHTYATDMLISNVNPAYACKILGNDLPVFLSHYAKWIDGYTDGNWARYASASGTDLAPNLSQKPPDDSVSPCFIETIFGAGDGNRTHVISLGS